MLFKENTIVYVGCPPFYKTGGTELAHQLVKAIRDKGRKAEILYYGIDNIDSKNINPAFQKYVNEYTIENKVQDDSDNILIVPEVNTELLNKYSKIQKSIWWMSVDNYRKWDDFTTCQKFFGILRACKYLFQGRISLHGKKIDKNIDHLYQSEYARQFLVSQGITRVYELSDYLNDTYLNTDAVSFDNRKDIVLYNPKKGAKFTKKLIKVAPDLNWKPIQNMSTDQVRDLLLKSKVYIDFGNHPGKDRFPREAAISGCCIITDKRGSARNNIDIKIPDKYKFDDNKKNIKEIISEIRVCLANYSKEIQNFAEYRQRILEEKDKFEKNVDDMISNKYN